MAPWIATIISALVAATVAFTLAGFGAAVAWGRVKQTLKNYEEKFAGVTDKIVDVSDEVGSLKRGIYNPNGTLIYVTASECEKRRAACDKIHAGNLLVVCGKIEEIRNDLKKDSEKRETAAVEFNNRLHKIDKNVALLTAEKNKEGES